MAKKEKQASSLVGGHFRAGTAMGDLYEAVSNGKSHTLGALKSAHKGVNILNRLYWLNRIGNEAGDFHLNWDGDTVRLVKGKSKDVNSTQKKAAKSSSKKVVAKAGKKSAKTAKPAAKPSGKPRVQDVPADED